MSKYSAVITVDAADYSITHAIYDSIKTDELFYPENPVKTVIAMTRDAKMAVASESDNLAHLRANINSTLRLVQACHASIAESVKI